MPTLTPRRRRIVQAVLYEAIAVALVAPTLAFAFDHPPASSLVLTLAMSAVALAWNWGYNTLFERWEARRPRRGRTLARRLVHGAGFEGGLVLLLVPMMAFWLDVTLLEAFVADLGLLVFFFGYTVVFTWAFDRAFGLPASARPDGGG